MRYSSFSSYLSRFLIILGLIIFIVQLASMWPHTVDDAYISMRYAQNWVSGDGLTWNFEGQRVEGYSNFLWVVVMSLFQKVGIDGIKAIKMTGAISAILHLPIIYLIGQKVGMTKTYSSVATLVYTLIPAVPFWAVSGLETPFATLLFISGIYLLLRNDSQYSISISSILFGLCALARHEGAPLFLMLSATYSLFFYRRYSAHTALKKSLVLIIPGTLIYFVYFLWRFKYYGYLLPNTAYIKEGLSQGPLAISHMLQFVSYLFPLILASLPGLYFIVSKNYSRKLFNIVLSLLSLLAIIIGMVSALFTPSFVETHLSPDNMISKKTQYVVQITRYLLAMLCLLSIVSAIYIYKYPAVARFFNIIPKRDRRFENILLLYLCVLYMCLLSIPVSSILMYGVRFFHPIIPLLSVVCVFGIGRIHTYQQKHYDYTSIAAVVYVVILSLMVNPFGINAIPIVQSSAHTKSRGGNFNSPIYSYDEFAKLATEYSLFMEKYVRPIGRFMAKNTSKKEYIAVPAAGAIPYICNCNTVDLLGLNSLQAAHGTQTPRDVFSKNPKFIILKSSKLSTHTSSASSMGVSDQSIFSSHTFQDRYTLVFSVDIEGKYYELYGNTDMSFLLFTNSDNIRNLRGDMRALLPATSLSKELPKSSATPAKGKDL